ATVEDALEMHRMAKKDSVWTVDRGGERRALTLPWKTRPVNKIGIEHGPDSSVFTVAQSSSAYAAGLRTGDVPVSVGNEPTPTVRSFLRTIGKSRDFGAAQVKRGDHEEVVDLSRVADMKAFAEGIAPG